MTQPPKVTPPLPTFLHPLPPVETPRTVNDAPTAHPQPNDSPTSLLLSFATLGMVNNAPITLPQPTATPRGMNNAPGMETAEVMNNEGKQQLYLFIYISE
jgi:hypothetical protein